MKHLYSRAWTIAVALLCAVAARAQSTIELRASAPIAAGTTVTLGQIARLEGAEAVALAGVVVTPVPGGSVGVEDVRKAVDAAGRVNWGRITLRGATCR